MLHKQHININKFQNKHLKTTAVNTQFLSCLHLQRLLHFIKINWPCQWWLQWL